MPDTMQRVCHFKKTLDISRFLGWIALLTEDPIPQYWRYFRSGWIIFARLKFNRFTLVVSAPRR